MLEYKSIPFEVKEMVSVDGGGWEISGYASTFGGTPDSYGDIIAAGAFRDSIASRPTKFLYEHSVPIGKQLEIREDDRGLFGRWSIIDTTTGTDAYKLAKAGVLDSLSIGYMTLDAEFREDGVRVLRKVDLFEVSAVAIPANVNAVITDVKRDQLAESKKAIGSHSTPTSSKRWDGPANEANLKADQAASYYRKAYAWADPDADPTTKAAYRFIHHEVSSDGTIGAANMRACSAGIAVLNGGRGGTTIPEADRAGVHRHLAKHMMDAEMEAPPLKSRDEIEAAARRSFDAHSDDVRVAVSEWLERIKSGADIRVKDGKPPLTDERRDLIAVLGGSLRMAADEVEALLTPPPPPERLLLGLELRRRRLERHGIDLIGATPS